MRLRSDETKTTWLKNLLEPEKRNAFGVASGLQLLGCYLSLKQECYVSLFFMKHECLKHGLIFIFG